MRTGLIYKSAKLYELVMLLLYGRYYSTRYRMLADLIEPRTSIVDVCCGPGILYERYLRFKDVSYIGIDINERFIQRLNRMGTRSLLCDVREATILPGADYVVIQASLYHFLPQPNRLIDQMLCAARKYVIVAEPIHNLATRRIPILTSLAKTLTDPGTGLQEARFTEESLDELFSHYSAEIVRSFVIPGGREKVYLLKGRSSELV